MIIRKPAVQVAVLLCFALCNLLTAAFAQDSTSACTPPQTDTSFVDDHGTVHVTRVVPVPDTVSPEAQKSLAQPRPDTEGPYDAAKDRAQASTWQVNGGEMMRKVYPVNITQQTIAGVPTRIVTPLTIPADRQNRLLINIHGGGFTADWGSEIETIPIANLTQTKVVAVLYPLAPEHSFPAAVNDIVGVYKELLKTYKPQNIGIYGTSAGAVLTAEVAARLRQLGLPLPAALGIFSGGGDFSKFADSMYMFTSGRDLILSNTVNLHRAFLRAGVNAQLVVFDGLPHAFWNNWNLPESQETYRMITDFFNQKLGK